MKVIESFAPTTAEFFLLGNLLLCCAFQNHAMANLSSDLSSSNGHFLGPASSFSSHPPHQPSPLIPSPQVSRAGRAKTTSISYISKASNHGRAHTTSSNSNIISDSDSEVVSDCYGANAQSL